MSNKDLLKLENEFRDQIVRYKEKPKIGPVARPLGLTKRVTDFLETTSNEKRQCETSKDNEEKSKAQVEMDIFITSM